MNIKCDLCESTFSSLVDFKIHLTENHREIPNKGEIYKLKAATWNVRDAIKEKKTKKDEKLENFNLKYIEIKKKLKGKHENTIGSTLENNFSKKKSTTEKGPSNKINKRAVKKKKKKSKNKKRKSVRVIYTAVETNRRRH